MSPSWIMSLLEDNGYAMYIEQLMSDLHVPGLSIAIVSGDRTVAAGYGHVSIEADAAPTTSETIYDCASMSKSFTAAAIARLIADQREDRGHNDDSKTDRKNQGGLSFQTPVSEILPGEFVLSDRFATEQVSIEDILSHRSGLPGHDISVLGVGAERPDDACSVTLNLRNLAMNAAPRTTYQYNNVLYTVASHIVEQVSGLSLASFLRSRFFEPLGMDSTYLQPSAVTDAGQKGRFSTPYEWRDGRYFQVDHLEQPEGQGAGSLQSTVLDYAKWVRAMLTKSDLVLPGHMYEELIKPRIIVDDNRENLKPFTSFASYALGWQTEFYRGFEIVKHGGLVPGYSSLMVFSPKLRVGMVFMGNSTSAESLADLLSMKLIDMLLYLSQEERVDWASRAKLKQAEEEDEDKSSFERLRQELLEEDHKSEDLGLPLEIYLGTYTNSGYHGLTVSLKDGKLYIDCTDRSTVASMTLNRVCDSQVFIATIYDKGGFENHKKAEFRIDESRQAVALGIALIDETERSFVWFERQ